MLHVVVGVRGGMCSLSMVLSSTVVALPAILPLLIADFVAAPSTSTTTSRDVTKAHAAKAHKDN